MADGSNAAKQRRWRAAHPEQALEMGRKWRAAHPLFRTWAGIIQRCTNPKHTAFANYGGRGITVCPEWRTFAPFEAWILAHLGPRPDGMTLDRIDNDGHYEPGNMRWATRSQQQRNKRPSPQGGAR